MYTIVQDIINPSENVLDLGITMSIETVLLTST